MMTKVVAVATTARNCAATIRAKICEGDRRTLVAFAAAILCAVSALDISQLLLALLGALAVALLQPLEVPGPRRPPKKLTESLPKAPVGKYIPPALRKRTGVSTAERDAVADTRRPVLPKAGTKPKLAGPPGLTGAVATPSFQPVLAPTFSAVGWDAQVDELVESLLPTPASESAVERLAARVRRAMLTIAPEAEVVAFASSASLRGRAFAVAVPDVDVVVSCSPAVLSARLEGGRASQQRQDMRQLQKVALRALTDRLVATGEFKFRRSAYSAEEPKITLVTTDKDNAIALDLSVNSATPLHNAALVTECGRLDARSRSLILLVRRWARDRGICYAAKGNFSPYCWTLMAIYFLQVSGEDGDQVLPALHGFKASSKLAGNAPDGDGGVGAAAAASARASAKKSVGELFREFVAFYSSRFDPKTEAVSVRMGRRAAPSLKLPLHIVLQEDGRTSVVVPSVEDPFDSSRNLAVGVTSLGLARWREELARAASRFSNAGDQASLTELLEPWSPEEGSPGAEPLSQ